MPYIRVDHPERPPPLSLQAILKAGCRPLSLSALDSNFHPVWGGPNRIIAVPDVKSLHEALTGVDVLVDETYEYNNTAYTMDTFLSNYEISHGDQDAFPFLRNDKVLRLDATLGKTIYGGTDWYEAGVIRPDVFVAELASYTYDLPDTFPAEMFMRNLATGHLPRVLTWEDAEPRCVCNATGAGERRPTALSDRVAVRAHAHVPYPCPCSHRTAVPPPPSPAPGVPVRIAVLITPIPPPAVTLRRPGLQRLRGQRLHHPGPQHAAFTSVAAVAVAVGRRPLRRRDCWHRDWRRRRRPPSALRHLPRLQREGAPALGLASRRSSECARVDLGMCERVAPPRCRRASPSSSHTRRWSRRPTTTVRLPRPKRRKTALGGVTRTQGWPARARERGGVEDTPDGWGERVSQQLHVVALG